MHRCRFSVFGVLAGLILSLNLFSGLAPSAKVSEAQASLRQIQGLSRQMESQGFLEVRQSYTQTASALQRIGVADQAALQAEEALRIVADCYNGGLLTIVDLLTAEVALQ